MTIRSWSRIIKDELNENFTVSGESMNSGNSPKVMKNGKLRLDLRSNTLDHVKSTAVVHWRRPTGPSNDLRAWSPPAGGAQIWAPPSGYSWTKLDNEAYAKFQGKIRKGSASMGVTLASWKQSRDMIISRSKHLGKTLDGCLESLQGNGKLREKLRRTKEPLANQVLEYEFGWVPLYQDLHAALTTVCKDGIPDEWVTSRARTYLMESWKDGSNPINRHTIDGQMQTSYNAKVAITNPNLWLLNRLGLINPATVLWDLIPWSFVVNMFVNTNAMINSITDEVGLSISNQNITRSVRFGYERFSQSTPSTQYPMGYPGPAFGRVSGKWKRRTVGTSLQPTWQVKVPDLNWELAVIATSLVVQKFKKINNVIRLI